MASHSRSPSKPARHFTRRSDCCHQSGFSHFLLDFKGDGQEPSDIYQQAIVELHNLQQVATRYTVQALTGMPLGRVDDRIKALVIQERIKRQLKGQYVPVETHPPARAISKTLMPDGMVKIEIGDDVLTLTPAEDRALSTLMAGAATQVAQIHSSQLMAEMASVMQIKVDAMARKLEFLRIESLINPMLPTGYPVGFLCQ